MTPNPQTVTKDREHSQEIHAENTSDLTGDEVVISGISGIFPKSKNVQELMENLYNQVDMVTSMRKKWKLNDPDVPKHMGNIKDIDKFDAQFFGVTFKLACVLEPMGRKLMEHAYGAIFDSGTCLQSLKGKRVGVFIGSSFADTSTLLLNIHSKCNRSDFIVNGSSKAMLANRISYWIDGKGPSYCLDYACSSSTAVLEIAYNSLKSGECDAAIVGGCNLGIHPNLTLNLRRAGLLCLDGKTKCFDKNADGYVRADAVNVIFLQKAKDAHRIYAQVYHAKGMYNMGPDTQFLSCRKSEDIEKFLSKFYSETDVQPENVEYIEAHGAAISKADENELIAISNIFAKNASVKVGSVKSNMGNSESASGICALTKLCLAYHKGKLPANLHYNEPHQISAVKDGRVQVVTKHTDFNRGFTALNNFSYTGAGYHVVLKGHYKEKDSEKYKSQIPHIILASGRQEECVQKILNIVKSHPIDPEEIGLLHKIFESDISGHTGRGYIILDKNENNETTSISESVDFYPGVKRPLWFVYSGMGSQWAGMGADLMRIPTFAAAIHKCHKVLASKGIDLIRVVTEPDNSIFDNILNAFVGIGAVQIGLTDVIKELGIVPDNIIGHSLGEMACAYHDDTFTAEELILSTYWRGKVVLESKLSKGSMAAVGVGYQTIINQCPPEIDVACHNSFESSTLSGPADKMEEFVGELTKRGVFAKEVPCANIAYHSRYIAQCGPELLRRLGEVIKYPKKRSSKWISTSVPQDRWNEPNAVYSSAEYHANNLLKPVLFEEMSKMIPNNAIVVEIAPHGLLQAILKRSLKECTHIPLTRRGNTEGVKFLLQAIGKLYQVGVNPKVEILYPKIEFPVSTETPLLSHYVKWEYSEDWPNQLSFLENIEIRKASARNVLISTHDDEYRFLKGHVRDGANVLPESAILVLVWDTLSMHIGVNYKDQSVVFEDIHFHSEVTIIPDIPLRLTISINRGNKRFEVSQDDTRIASGIVNNVKVLKFYRNVGELETNEEEIILNCEDVYKILKSRGYSYKDKFQSIQSSNLDCNRAFVQWDNDWITFLDALIQFNTLSRNYEGISTPKFIRKISISILEQNISKSVVVNGLDCFSAHYSGIHKVVRCAGVELDNVTFIDKFGVDQQPDLMVTRAFYPHYAMDNVDLKTALQIIVQIIAENTTMKKIKFTEIVTSNANVNCIIKDLSGCIPNVMIDVDSVINIDTNFDILIQHNSDVDKINVFIIENLFEDQKKLESLRNISKDSFILALETGMPKHQEYIKDHFSVVSSMSDGKQILILLKKKNHKDVTYIPVNCYKLDWVSRVYDELNKTKRVVLVSQRQSYCGALGFVEKLRNDGMDKVGLVVIDDFHAPSFDPYIGIYKDQLQKNLAINIFRKGQWGGLYYTPCTKSTNLRNVILTRKSSDIDSLTWIEAPPFRSSNNLVQVSYAGISLRDVQKAVSNSNGDEATYGMDFSGIDSDGDRVMGLVPSGALSTTVEADSALLWPVPDHWSLQDAATVPLPYAMAYYCLTIRAQLLKHQSVFVTGGAGAFGQAVIALCLSLDCTVFTTVSNEYKKKMLLRLFPKLDENNISFSYDSFLCMIKSRGSNKGCDFVINCASGPLRVIAMNCVAFAGFYMDLNVYDMSENMNIGMSYLGRSRSYNAVNFSNVFRPENAEDKKILQLMLSEGISKGIVKPISRVEFSPIEISRAFRFISSSKHMGKVLLRMRSPEILKQGFDVVPRMNYDAKGVFIVVCDDYCLGIELADRLVKRGSRKIVLHMQSKVSGYLHKKFVSWKKNNVSIKISLENLHTPQGCTKLLKEAARLGSIKGIFVVLNIEDKNDENAQEFVRKFNKTAIAVINLDLTSRSYCNELSHFVILTTSAQSAGSEFSASVSEKICQGRSESGFPAVFVRTNALTGLSRIPNDREIIMQPLTLSAFFNTMEKSLKLKYNNILSYNIIKNDARDYLIKLAKVLGFAEMDNIEDETVVNDLKLTEIKLEELQGLIRNVHKINYPIDKIQRMTLFNLKNIKNNTKEKPKDCSDGMGAFYTMVDSEEENLATQHPIIPMATLLNNGTQNDLDPNETYLTLISGFEGRHQIFATIAERLKIEAVAVHLASDLEGNSIQEMAAIVRKFMRTKFESKSKFYLLGYSFGVNVALELAALLENEGHIGVVYCLDSSPDALRTQLESYLGDLNDSELQNIVLKHLCQLMTGQKCEELCQYLKKAGDWTSKINAATNTLRGLANYSNQYKYSILQSAYKKIMLAKEYEPDFKLKSELILMRGIPHPKAKNLAEDYNLSKYTEKPVVVFQIESDHASAPYDCGVSNIVNKMLDPKLLQEFKTKNLCDMYFMN